ncbi:uncharacterized protein [Miscanthus floridulus]|uniref:uncharacterized protein n=1 Tax=Miscanthus floridulus TaxID=154761 RepID=UPI00345A2131
MLQARILAVGPSSTTKPTSPTTRTPPQVECRTREDGQLIKVTFCLAKTPLLSHFCIHCPGMGPEKFGTEPSIFATEERFALLPSSGSPSSVHPARCFRNTVITSSTRPAASAAPPRSHRCFSCSPILTLWNSLTTRLICPRRTTAPKRNWCLYKLHLFSGEADNWTSRVVSCDPPLPQRYSFWCIDKVITIDTKRGLMGWVDLWRGILICDVLSKNPVLQYVPLPTPVVCHVPGMGSPDIVRDMVAVRGTVRYFEMKPKVIVETRRIQGWIATTWSTWIEHSWKWHEECILDVFDVVIDRNNHIELLASPKGNDNTKPILSLRVASPALSLEDDYLVYFMAKIDSSDDNAWIISVDMKNQSLQGVAEFSAERTMGVQCNYLRSTISKFMYLKQSTRQRRRC